MCIIHYFHQFISTFIQRSYNIKLAFVTILQSTKQLCIIHVLTAPFKDLIKYLHVVHFH